ncbi:FtsW/RodA/SpoVE family cell cycle protein [Streptococcus loxodontisalivarius]|uniref:Rod shape determining protein RodA n=1 Tax=Streptococcus loxodontisalivarius TaxID=1349415 RepID=A0ABS2PQ61_9STRE|nr:FtsW/RodA/SpoVE family cell cycle protein [Streptococcus loxodontisalivarius]MBM7642183.1 rod shape determining protein RodA [Streptococcus loxodontisalivarius]
MASKKNNIESRIDYSLVLPVFLLLIIGFVAIYLVASNDYPKRLVSIMIQQGAWTGLGLAIAFVVMLFNTQFLWRVTPWLYGLGLFLMILPLVFYSPELVASTGAKNWVTIANTTLFQPSEFMKISYILMLARTTLWFNDLSKERDLRHDFKLLGWYGAVTLPVFILLALQKDLGTAMVFVAILAGTILIAGISWKIILPVVLIMVLAVAVFMGLFLWDSGREFLYKMGMDTYQLNRISAWLDPFSYASGIAYQQTQGMISIGIGGLTGTGSSSLELSVPVRESDMIFTAIAEHFGFIGGLIVLLLYLWLIYRLVRVTIASNNQFYTLISTGFIMMIMFHIFENIGATVGILPLTGIPLPFISQGGSSLISNLIGVGLILSMSYQKNLQDEEIFMKNMRRSARYK